MPSSTKSYVYKRKKGMPRRYYTKNKKFKKWNKPIYPGETNNIHFHKRWSIGQQSFAVQTSDVGSSLIEYRLIFSLDQVANSGELLSLYDVYRIKYVKVRLVPRTQIVSQALSTGGSNYQQTLKLIYAIDYDSSAAGQTSSDLRQYQTSKIIEYGDRDNKNLTIFFTPRINFATEQVNAGYGFTNVSGWQWCDTNSPTIKHFGVKMLLQNLTTGSNFVSAQVGLGYDINVQYYLEFKNTR